MNQLKRAFLFGVTGLAFAGLSWVLMSGKPAGPVVERGAVNGVVSGVVDGVINGAVDGVVSGAVDGIVSHAVNERAEAMAWMSIDEATGKLQKEQRPVLIDLYTTWCGWCKQMDRKTYSNKQVAQYLQEKFYPVKVDAESKATIKWNGRSYQFNANYRANEFAIYLAHGQLEFPTTIIIPPGGEPQAIPGYMEPKELEMLVKYFGEGKYKTQSFDEYQRSFKASW